MQTAHLAAREPSGAAATGRGTFGARVGHASESGGNRHSEDFFGSVVPRDDELEAKGVLLALADGLSGGDGRAAAESIVHSVLSDYYATPPTVSVELGLGKVIEAVNRWLYAQNASAGDDGGMLTTFSALVLRGRRYHVAHVGDTRIYRVRNAKLHRLTTDHVWRAGAMQRVLRRALGLDAKVIIEFADGDLAPGDAFLMLSDGVWEMLREAEIVELLAAEPDPQKAAAALVERAVVREGQFAQASDATAAVIRIDALRA